MAYIDTNLFSEIEIFKKIQFNSEIGHFTNLFETSWLSKNFVQDSVSFSKLKGTIKGFHFQKKPFDQAKLNCLPERVRRQFELTYGHDIQLHQKLAADQIP